MTDALRSDRPGDAPDRERDARIEQLLLSGLDHYFAGHHELAINVWTRVLFLDRGHARARAYIERARGALSERQREGDELLHAGADALHRGDHASARRLLTSAVDRGASGDDAVALLHRLDRLEAASATPGSRARQLFSTATRDPSPEGDPPAGRSKLAWVSSGIVWGVLVAALAGTYLWMAADPFDVNANQSSAPALAEELPPVLPPCEIRLLRARDLYAKGRLAEAAAELESGDPDGRHGVSMRELRAAIQRQLLASSRRPGSTDDTATGGVSPANPTK